MFQAFFSLELVDPGAGALWREVREGTEFSIERFGAGEEVLAHLACGHLTGEHLLAQLDGCEVVQLVRHLGHPPIDRGAPLLHEELICA